MHVVADAVDVARVGGVPEGRRVAEVGLGSEEKLEGDVCRARGVGDEALGVITFSYGRAHAVEFITWMNGTLADLVSNPCICNINHHHRRTSSFRILPFQPRCKDLRFVHVLRHRLRHPRDVHWRSRLRDYRRRSGIVEEPPLNAHGGTR